MASLDIYNLSNSKVGAAEINDDIVSTVYHPHVIKSVVVNYMAGLRSGTHKTKGRSEIAGSTRKLYKQKGTGNARVGDKKSPTRRGGGTMFGPVPRDYSYKINKKEKKLALKSAIAQKIRENDLVVLDNMDIDSGKTKDFAKLLSNWEGRSYLLVSEELNENLVLSSRNLSNVKLLNCNSVNVYDVLRYEKLLISKKALAHLENLVK